LSKYKAARYQNAEDLLADLKQLPAKLPTIDTQGDVTRTTQVSEITPNESLAHSIPGKVRRNKFAVLGTTLALILLGVAISRWVSTEHLDSLAILPFTYASSDPQLMANPDREYLSDGLTESLINNLSQLHDLKVIARSSVFRYKGQNLDVQALGRELNVQAVLVGQVKQE